jgi:hypothetical protein
MMYSPRHPVLIPGKLAHFALELVSRALSFGVISSRSTLYLTPAMTRYETIDCVQVENCRPVFGQPGAPQGITRLFRAPGEATSQTCYVTNRRRPNGARLQLIGGEIWVTIAQGLSTQLPAPVNRRGGVVVSRGKAPLAADRPPP